MLTKEESVERIEISELGIVHVRYARVIKEDGVVISGPTYRRVTYEPGQDVSKESQRIRDVATAVWTAEVIDTYTRQHSKDLETSRATLRK